MHGVCQVGVPGSPKHSTPSPEWKGGGYPGSLISSLALALLMSKPKPSRHRDRHTHTRSALPWAAWETGLGTGRNQDSSEGQAAGRAGAAQSRNLRQEADEVSKPLGRSAQESERRRSSLATLGSPVLEGRGGGAWWALSGVEKR